MNTPNRDGLSGFSAEKEGKEIWQVLFIHIKVSKMPRGLSSYIFFFTYIYKKKILWFF